MKKRRKYPIGTYTFQGFIEDGYLYIDKTDLVWEIAHEAKFIFLSRPRRFGKSLLTTTLKSYFEGRKDLFEGLKIMDLEEEWTAYPTFRFDLSGIKELQIENMQESLRRTVAGYERKFGFSSDALEPGDALKNLIEALYLNTGKKSVIILDEYDAPLLNYLDKPEPLEKVRQLLKEFYTPLKESDAYLHYVFMTGITKFSQLSIFSTINNIKNVSMLPKYAAICGLTEQEVFDNFPEEIHALAERYRKTDAEMRQRLKERYDGYHFASQSPDIYNPFSVLTAMADTDLGAYWFSSGNSGSLARIIASYGTDMEQVDGVSLPSAEFDLPTEAMTNAIPLLYQAGYITIKDYDPDSECYTLGIPNGEVRVGLMTNLMPLAFQTTSLKMHDMAMRFKKAILRDDIEAALLALKSFFAGIPYPEDKDKVLDTAEKMEFYYKRLFFMAFSFMNAQLYTEVPQAVGRPDVIMHLGDTVYVYEIKLDGSAEEAMEQIESRNYALPYQNQGKQVVKIAINFSTQTRTFERWIIAKS